MTPKTYLIGQTTLDNQQLYRYLLDTKQEGFLDDTQGHKQEVNGKGDQYRFWGMQCLVSFYAKLCYKSLVPGKNDNITKTRSIKDNLEGVIKSGHGSVLEHATFNFVTTDCSRIFTHELVRHRVGTAFSQTSGRYVRSDELEMVLGDPILDEVVKDDVPLNQGASIRAEMENFCASISRMYNNLVGAINWEGMDFSEKKKLTSALRRMLPNGQANEIGWSANARTLRHLIQSRTSPLAEWEIRVVFQQVYDLVKDSIFFSDATVHEDGSVTFENQT